MINPVFRKEAKTSLRNWKIFYAIAGYVLLVTLTAIVSIWQMMYNSYYASFDPANMTNLYIGLTVLELVLVLLITPAMTGGSISGERERQTLLVPKVGSAVIVGSLGGDYTELVVLQVDEVESIVFNGGRLGGLVNIDALTEKINGLIDAFNGHTHSIPPSGVTVEGTTNIQPVTVPAVARKADRLEAEDFEDKNIRH